LIARELSRDVSTIIREINRYIRKNNLLKIFISPVITIKLSIQEAHLPQPTPTIFPALYNRCKQE